MDVLADGLATVRFQAALSGSLRVAAPWAPPVRRPLRDGGGGRGPAGVMAWPDPGNCPLGGTGPVTRLLSSCLPSGEAERTPRP